MQIVKESRKNSKMEITNPARCIIGTIGLPGDRTFFWQIKDAKNVYSIKIEKQQAAVIADQVDSLLDDLKLSPNFSGKKKFPTEDLDPLELPIDFFYELVSLGVYIVDEYVQLELKLYNATMDDMQLKVNLSINQSREFCARARSVVAAGRGVCPLCELPIEPTGHICVRANGYRR